MNEDLKSYLKILEIEEVKNPEELKSKVRKLILKYHPDLNPEGKVQSEEKLKKILFAYEKIKNELQKNPELFFSKEERKEKKTAKSIYSTKFLIFILENQEFAIPVEYINGVSRLKDLEYKTSGNSIIANFRGKYIYLNYSNNILPKEYVIIIKEKNGMLVDKVEDIITISQPILLDGKTKFLRYENRYIPLFKLGGI